MLTDSENGPLFHYLGFEAPHLSSATSSALLGMAAYKRVNFKHTKRNAHIA